MNDPQCLLPSPTHSSSPVRLLTDVDKVASHAFSYGIADIAIFRLMRRNLCVVLWVINYVSLIRHRDVLIQIWRMTMTLSLSASLVDQSMLTRRQLEALQLYIRIAHGEMRYREATSVASQGRTKGEDKPLTVGSYFRTVQQARQNIRKSVITLLIGLWSEAVKPEDIRRLLEVAGGGPKEVSDEERDQIVVVLRTLVQKIVM